MIKAKNSPTVAYAKEYDEPDAGIRNDNSA